MEHGVSGKRAWHTSVERPWASTKAHRMIRTRHLLLMVAVLSVSSSLLAREWVDSSGKHKVEAEFVKLEGEVVHLRKANGKVIKMPIGRLSEADQAYARDRRSKKADDKDRIAKQPVPKVGSLKELLKLSKKARRAKHVLAVYQKFLENPSVSDDEKAEARSGIKRWEDLAAIDG